MHGAALEGHIDIVRFLVDHGAHVDTQDRARPPPHAASSQHRIRCYITVICNANAPVEARARSSEPPFVNANFNSRIRHNAVGA